MAKQRKKRLTPEEKELLRQQEIFREWYATDEDSIDARPLEERMQEEIDRLRKERDAALALIRAMDDEFLAIRIHMEHITKLIQPWEAALGSTAEERREKWLNSLTHDPNRV